MAAGKSNFLAPTQAAAGNGNGVRFRVGGGEGEEGNSAHSSTVPQVMLCPSNINNKHNSRHGNNNSNKSVTTARTQWQEEREGRWERGGTEGRRQGPAKTKAKSVGRQQKYKQK